jgi:proline iminopeptidase
MLTDSSRFGFYKDVEDMEAVRRTLRISRMSLLGWSYFGGVAAVYASTHPDRVLRIVQVGPIAPRSGGGWNDTRQISRQVDTAAIRGIQEMRSKLRTASDSLLFCRLDVRHRMLPGAMADTAAIARMKADPCTSQNETPERWRRSVALALAQLGGNYDFRPRLGAVKVPVLVVWGDADAAPEASVREWVRSWPDARLLIVRGAGHLPWLEHPEVFFPAVDSFLRGSWPSQAGPSR